MGTHPLFFCHKHQIQQGCQVESRTIICAYFPTYSILASLKPSQCTFNPISLLTAWTFRSISFSFSFHCNLSILWKLLAFPEPPGSFIRVDFMFFIMHTASITNFTPAGGLFIPFSSDISFFVSVSNAYTNHVPNLKLLLTLLWTRIPNIQHGTCIINAYKHVE